MKKNTIILSFMFLTMLIMGSVYSYSVYRPFIESQYEISTTLSGIPYMMSLFFYALSMYGFGKLMHGGNLKLLSLLGSILLPTGFMISAFSPNIIFFTLGYGLVMGVSVGILYGLILYFIQQEFQTNSGLISGILLFGFGLSSVFVAPIAQRILEIYTLRSLFIGLMFISFFTAFPIYFWLSAKPGQKNIKVNLSTHNEWRLFFLTTMIGLTMIGLTASVGTSQYGFNPSQMAIMVAIFAFLNAISRIIFGFFMDRIGFRKSGWISLSLILIGTLLNTINQGESLVLFAIGYGLYWFNLGAWLSMMPTFIKNKYGKEAYGSLYGKVFTAYGVSAIIGTLLSGLILDILQTTSFIYLGLLLIIIWSGVEVHLLTKNKATLS